MPSERQAFDRCGLPQLIVVQSLFQQRHLRSILVRWGFKSPQFRLIRGAFEMSDFDWSPRLHRREEKFIVGRLARPDPDKWSKNTWGIYKAIPYSKVGARVMGWTQELQAKCGVPPVWVEVLPPCAESAFEFLRSLHCLISVNGGARENWPRAGLEAMATGVPVIAERDWGWIELIEHEVTGYLCKDRHEMAFYAAQLAYDESLRLQISRNAREAVESLADPHILGNLWETAFADASRGSAKAERVSHLSASSETSVASH